MTEIRTHGSELRKILDWLEENNIPDNLIVTIETGNAGGIGQYIRAIVETKEGKGIWIDATDYDTF
jgi:hypothetical protein